MIDNAITDTDRADIVIQGLPYYMTCGVKSPNAYKSFIKSFNSLSSLNMRTRVDVFDKFIIACPDPISNYNEMERWIKKNNKGQHFIFIGGEHLITLPVIKALRPKRVLIFDAHADYHDEYNGRKESYATVTRRISELVDKVYLTGVRDLTIEEMNSLKNSNVELISIKDLDKIPSSELYISIDLDILDPSHCPEVSTPVPLGISMHDLVNALKTVCLKNNIIGLDVNELTCDKPGLSSINAAGIVMNYLWTRR